MWCTVVLSVFFVFFLDVASGQQWTGNVCYRRKCVYYTVRVCAYRTWAGCCYYRYYRRARIVSLPYCCRGWRESAPRRCDQAICIPPCQNGGKCEKPNMCRCLDGSTGDRCNILICNYQRPCFPGVCQPSTIPANVGCACTSGFEHASPNQIDFCRKLTEDQKPDIFETRARLSFWPRGMTPSMEKYALYVDSSDSNEIDYVWTNRPDFNWLNVSGIAMFENEDVDAPPIYISVAKLGIVKAEAHLLLEKIPYIGSPFNPVISLNMSLPCEAVVGWNSPDDGMYICNISKPNFDSQLENADILTITFQVWSGGFRIPSQVIPIRRDKDTQKFTGRMRSHAVQIKFDFLKPVHQCLEDNLASCSVPALSLDADITQDPIKLVWGNWTDVPAGMFRYAWEVFRLEANGDKILREPKPLGPIHGPIEVMHDTGAAGRFEATYTPPQAGVYSFILEASDRANNSIFVRRIAIYDPSSSISTDLGHRLFVSSANPQGDYNWQQNSSSPITVTWTRHFVNLVHEEGSWLNSVLAYPPELEDYLKDIKRDTRQDDHEGKRTVESIDNERGIVQFEIAYQKDSEGGVIQQAPLNGWKNVGRSMMHTIDKTSMGGLSQSDTLTVWVRATDAMGNTRVDATKVSFDDSPPDCSDPVFQRNEQTENIPFSSSLDVTLFDMQSGLKRMDMVVSKGSNGFHVRNTTYRLPSIPKSACPNQAQFGCICPPALDVCYKKDRSIPISNCDLMVEEADLSTETVVVDLFFMNMAGLVTSKNITVDNLLTLNGTQAFLGPRNLNISKVAMKTLTVTWTHSPSCYERTEMWVNYRSEGTELNMKKLHWEATEYTIIDLKPETEYTIELISQYGERKSTPIVINAETAPLPAPEGLSGGAIAGIIIGVLLLLILILLIVGFLLYRRGYLAGVLRKRKENQYQESHVEAPKAAVKSSAGRISKWGIGYDNHMYQKDEEIYVYGSMGLGEPWYVGPDELTLISEIATGKFAKIYKAKWRESPKQVKEVVAKIVKNRESENDTFLMMAKINFAATQVGDHRNIVGFYGAVMENDALGPVMIMEYCESGQLDKWLVKQRSKVTDDIIDRIQNFALEIARSMEYLASKGIVHRKLAARNCLLTFLLEIKVTGFGPCQSDDSADDTKGDRIPIKWTAPECLSSLKDANQKSDVWSYGITLWEIFSMGEQPYQNIRGRDIPSKISGDYRMARPEYAEDTHYNIMKNCWNKVPRNRPDFKDIVSDLESTFGLRPDGGDQNYYYQR